MQLLNDYEMTAFIRSRIRPDRQLLRIRSTPGAYSAQFSNYTDDDRRIVWPDSNLIEITLDDFVDLKVERDKAMVERPDLYDNSRCTGKK